MSTTSSKKNINSVRQAVLLKQMLKKWRSLSLRQHHNKPHHSTDPTTTTCSFSPKFRRPSTFSFDHQEEEREEKPANPRRTPAGYVAVYVGPERRRFVIPTRYVNLPVFAALLQQSEEEFGYQSSGAIALPCDVSLFTALLGALRKKEKAFARLALDDFLKLLPLSSSNDDGHGTGAGGDEGYTGASCRVSRHRKGLFHNPLLQKARA